MLLVVPALFAHARQQDSLRHPPPRGRQSKDSVVGLSVENCWLSLSLPCWC